MGATVATTTSSKNIELVKSLGADLIIDYTTQSFEDELSDYDLVFDMIGGDVLTKSFKVLKKGGTLISIKGQDTEELAKKYGVNFEWFFMSPDGAMLTELVTLISQGTIKTVIDSTYPMEQASEAFGKLAESVLKLSLLNYCPYSLSKLKSRTEKLKDNIVKFTKTIKIWCWFFGL